MRVIERGSCRQPEYRSLQCRVIKELATVVCCDGLEHDFERLLAHRSFDTIDGPSHRSLSLVLDLADDQLSALTLNQSEQGGTSSSSLRSLDRSPSARPVAYQRPPPTTRQYSDLRMSRV
ncbi:MAG: hypothetical protein V5783_08195 [Pontiella sp.]